VSSEGDLRFPKKLVLGLVEETTGLPVPNIAMTLTLHARRKNDYHFAPSLSDSTGTITIEREWVKTSIEEVRDFYLMDYQSTMEDCLPQVHLDVMTSEEITRAIDAARLYKDVKERLGVMLTVSDLQKASNNAYESKEIRLSFEEPDVEFLELSISLLSRRVSD